MCSEWMLGVWSGAGIVWWLISWGLVAAESKRRPARPSGVRNDDFLSIFKPLAPLDQSEVMTGLESFIAQLDERSELLLGVHEADREAIAPFLKKMGSCFPKTKLKVVYRSKPDELANPKIAWQKILAGQAEGELWLWSDADIVAPPGFIRSIREEYKRSGAAMLTFPYVVREMATSPAFLDALYVNVEFYPGVLFLRRRGPVDFGLGAGMLFRRSDFLRRVEWGEIGAALADDFVLGQRLHPVRVSETTLDTGAEVVTWREAWSHYLRWSKTVWWNRPAGSAARVIALPVLGWIGYLLFHPGAGWAWAGLAGMMQIDVIFALTICRTLRCRWTVRDLLTMEGWSLGRVLVWLACWLPWPVVWRGRRWWGCGRH
jgi:hypothetical protein